MKSAVLDQKAVYKKLIIFPGMPQHFETIRREANTGNVHKDF